MIGESWARIVGWCEQHAPEVVRTLRPPAGEEALAAAEAATGCEWPEDLRQWYRLHDGCREYPYSLLLAPWMPLPLEGIVQEARRLAALQADLDRMPWADPHAVERSGREPAGVVAAGFLSTSVPVAVDLQEGTLFVDTRPGRWSGCVTEREGADGRRWDSVTEMLGEIADVLEGGGTSGHLRATTVSRWLEWEHVPGPDREPREGSWPQEPEMSDEEAVARLRESQEPSATWDWSSELVAGEVEVEGPAGVPAEVEVSPGFEPDRVLLAAVLAEIDRNPVVEKVRDLPLGRLDALSWATQGAQSGVLASVLTRWGVDARSLVRVDGAMAYHLVGEGPYTAVDRGAGAALEALRLPLLNREPEGEALRDLSPGEFVDRWAEWAEAHHGDEEVSVDFLAWSRNR